MTVVSVFCIMYLSLYTRKQNAPVWADPEGDRGSRFLLKNHKNKGFLSDTGPDRLKKNTKLPSQHSLLGHLWPASETPFKLRFAGGPMMPTYSGICLYPLPSKRTLSKLDPLWQTFLDPRMSLIRNLLLLAHFLSLITCNCSFIKLVISSFCYHF